jgi:hypothetical protein
MTPLPQGLLTQHWREMDSNQWYLRHEKPAL